jgi:hypothetical protein
VVGEVERGAGEFEVGAGDGMEAAGQKGQAADVCCNWNRLHVVL